MEFVYPSLIPLKEFTGSANVSLDAGATVIVKVDLPDDAILLGIPVATVDNTAITIELVGAEEGNVIVYKATNTDTTNAQNGTITVKCYGVRGI